MVDFSLNDEERQIRDTVRAFIEREVMPLEPEVLRNERAGRPGVERAVIRELQLKARRSGFWGVLTPEEYGGMDLGPVMAAIIAMETGRTFVPFQFGGAADNILYFANDEQKQRYLIPTIEGERISCFAITEPGAGSDARSIRSSARRDGGDFVINGEKTFITNGNEADFVMVFAVVPDKGVTCFLVDRDMGWKSEPIPTMGEWGPASLVFDDVRVPADSVLGEPVHGKPGTVVRTRPDGPGAGLLAGLPARFTAARYHSLYAVPEQVKGGFEVTAVTADQVVMANEDAAAGRWAVQYHPESILTAAGGAGHQVIANVLRLCRDRASRQLVT